MITADRGIFQILGSDFGFWLLGSSDRGSQRSPGNLTFSFLCAGCYPVEKSSALKCDGSVMAVMKAVKFAEVCYCSVLSRMALATDLLSFFRICWIFFRYRQTLFT